MQMASLFIQWFKPIGSVIRSFRLGFGLTWSHFKKGNKRQKPKGIADPDYFQQSEGLVTIQYPHEQIPVPDQGRYRLHMETEDCIVCDQCARICPVDCITIEGIKTTDDLGLTSDGTKKKLYLPTFDIDMAKCCYCGLCTTVCPTECLTMTKVYDFSETDRDAFIYHYGNLSPEEAKVKQQEAEALEEARKAAKLAASKASA
jgi:NADH-quinone oxidoreductase subunit I